ncbi:MAG: insulinase family protein [Treponema sp.]|jgi:predicted Zn-dependent peptidase|nr:insulinase family protein [Treponema sp.]
MAIQKRTLNNNIVLITEPIDTAKTVSVGFWFPVGSRFETDKNRGVTHFVEHMLFKRTLKKTAFDIARAFDRIGGYINAFTERDLMCLHATVPSEHLEYTLSIMCEMVTDSVFAEEDIERERKVIESEIITSQDDPEEVAFDELYAVLFPNQGISESIAGSVNDVSLLTRNEIFNWYKDNVSLGALSVIICGNADIEKAALILENLEKRNLPLEILAKPEWAVSKKNIKAPFQQNQIFAAFPIKLPLTEKKINCLTVLNAVIGDTMSSRLFQRLREQNGYCYTVYSFITLFSDCAFWCAYASVAKKNTSIVLKELDNELKKLFSGDLNEMEIEAAKEHIVGEEIIASEDVELRMKRLARLHFSNFPLIVYTEFVKNIRSLSKEDLLFQLSEMLDFSKETIVVYGGSYGFKSFFKCKN